MSHINPDTPKRASHDFMKYGGVKLFHAYVTIKSGMTSVKGLVIYADPTIAFSAMDIIKETITKAVTDKDSVIERKKIKELKDAMRKNIPFVEAHYNNDLATLLLSGYNRSLS